MFYISNSHDVIHPTEEDVLDIIKMFESFFEEYPDREYVSDRLFSLKHCYVINKCSIEKDVRYVASLANN